MNVVYMNNHKLFYKKKTVKKGGNLIIKSPTVAILDNSNFNQSTLVGVSTLNNAYSSILKPPFETGLDKSNSFQSKLVGGKKRKVNKKTMKKSQKNKKHVKK